VVLIYKLDLFRFIQSGLCSSLQSIPIQSNAVRHSGYCIKM